MTHTTTCKHCNKQRPYHAKGLCRSCYRRHYRKMNPSCQRDWYHAHRESVRAQQRESWRSRWEASPGGVYALICKPTGEVYFGATGCFAKRESLHFSKGSLGKHENQLVREWFKKYGPGAIRFEPLVEINDKVHREAVEACLIITEPCVNIRNAEHLLVTVPNITAKALRQRRAELLAQ